LEEVTTASFHNFSTSAFFNLPTIRRCISCAPERIPLYNRSINHEASRIILSIAFFISYSDIFDTLFAVAFNLYTSLKLRFIFLMISWMRIVWVMCWLGDKPEGQRPSCNSLPLDTWPASTFESKNGPDCFCDKYLNQC
jgi:hypothetical protein